MNESRLPDPFRLYRIVHYKNLDTLIRRGGLHAPSQVPDDGFPYIPIQKEELGNKRSHRQIPIGPGGTIHDYVQFYLGPRSPMLYCLHHGGVEGYAGTQREIVYLVVYLEDVVNSGRAFVFTDGHAIQGISKFCNNLSKLDILDWEAISAPQWFKTNDFDDRKRKKQAEFMIHGFYPWSLIRGIAVCSEEMKEVVETMLDKYPEGDRKKVAVVKAWYY